MKTFTDTTGRTWTIALTLDAAKRVRGLLDVNLLELDAGDPPLLTRLGTDVILLCDVIFALVKPQADANGITDEEFGAALGGEAILAAQTALYEELVDFFQGLGRSDLARVVDAQRRMIDLAIARIETRIDQLDLDAAIESCLPDLPADRQGGQATPGESSTNLPASAASIPGR